MGVQNAITFNVMVRAGVGQRSDRDSPIPFSPGHRAGLHFLDDFVVQFGLVTKRM